MKNSIIQIPVPCHENWNTMSQQEKGKFCSVCSKTVMDFSRHSKNEIVNYMSENAGQSICGNVPARMLNEQVPFHISSEQRSSLSRFAFALLLVFGNFLFGYGQNQIRGQVSVETVEKTQIPDTLSLIDTLQYGSSLPITDSSQTIFSVDEPMILGLMLMPVEPVFIESEEEESIKGEIKTVIKPEE